MQNEAFLLGQSGRIKRDAEDRVVLRKLLKKNNSKGGGVSSFVAGSKALSFRETQGRFVAQIIQELTSEQNTPLLRFNYAKVPAFCQKSTKIESCGILEVPM